MAKTFIRGISRTPDNEKSHEPSRNVSTNNFPPSKEEAKFSKAVVVGPPGSGKSTLIQCNYSSIFFSFYSNETV